MSVSSQSVTTIHGPLAAPAPFVASSRAEAIVMSMGHGGLELG